MLLGYGLETIYTEAIDYQRHTWETDTVCEFSDAVRHVLNQRGYSGDSPAALNVIEKLQVRVDHEIYSDLYRELPDAPPVPPHPDFEFVELSREERHEWISKLVREVDGE